MRADIEAGPVIGRRDIGERCVIRRSAVPEISRVGGQTKRSVRGCDCHRGGEELLHGSYSNATDFATAHEAPSTSRATRPLLNNLLSPARHSALQSNMLEGKRFLVLNEASRRDEESVNFVEHTCRAETAAVTPLYKGGSRGRVCREVHRRHPWCCRTGLNCRPLPYQGNALPLSDASTDAGKISPGKSRYWRRFLPQAPRWRKHGNRLGRLRSNLVPLFRPQRARFDRVEAAG